MVSNGAPLVVSGSLAPNSTDSSQESLSGYVGNFTLGATNDKFLVNVEYVVIVPTGASITATDELDFSLSIRNTTFNTVFGDIGSQDLSVDVDATSLDFFNEFQTGSITFADPSIELIFENSFGFPVGVSFPEFAGITSDGTTIRLTGSINDNVNIITGPTVNERGQILTTNLPINRENSNISELLSAQPEELRISVNAVTNPAGTNQYNFIDETALLDVTTRIEIPFELNINNLGAEQSLDFSGGADLQDASRLLFRLISENELPMGGEVELIFRDANDNTLVQVDPVTAFSAAPVGADGRTNDVATSTADIVLEEDDIRAIENATSIGLVVTLSTTDAQSNQAVKFFEDYELKVKLAVQADVSLNANGN